MDNLYIASGFGLLCVGLAVMRVITTLHGPYTGAKKTESEPILIPEYRPRGREGRNAPSSRP